MQKITYIITACIFTIIVAIFILLALQRKLSPKPSPKPGPKPGPKPSPTPSPTPSPKKYKMSKEMIPVPHKSGNEDQIFSDGVAIKEGVVCIPYNSKCIGFINFDNKSFDCVVDMPENRRMYNKGVATGIESGVIFAPNESNLFGYYTHINKSFTTIDTGLIHTSSQPRTLYPFTDAVATKSGHIVFVPNNNDQIVVYNSYSKSFNVIHKNLGKANLLFSKGILLPDDRVFLVPLSYRTALICDTHNNTCKEIGNFEHNSGEDLDLKFNTGCYIGNNKVAMFPSKRIYILILDIITGKQKKINIYQNEFSISRTFMYMTYYTVSTSNYLVTKYDNNDKYNIIIFNKDDYSIKRIRIGGSSDEYDSAFVLHSTPDNKVVISILTNNDTNGNIYLLDPSKGDYSYICGTKSLHAVQYKNNIACIPLERDEDMCVLNYKKE